MNTSVPVPDDGHTQSLAHQIFIPYWCRWLPKKIKLQHNILFQWQRPTMTTNNMNIHWRILLVHTFYTLTCFLQAPLLQNNFTLW